jgi:hypothetical protein
MFTDPVDELPFDSKLRTLEHYKKEPCGGAEARHKFSSVKLSDRVASRS